VLVGSRSRWEKKLRFNMGIGSPTKGAVQRLCWCGCGISLVGAGVHLEILHLAWSLSLELDCWRDYSTYVRICQVGGARWRRG
jgi:hypothetical protein